MRVPKKIKVRKNPRTRNDKCRHEWITNILTQDEKKELRRKGRSWGTIVSPRCKTGTAKLLKGRE